MTSRRAGFALSIVFALAASSVGTAVAAASDGGRDDVRPPATAVRAGVTVAAQVRWDTCRASVPDRARCGHIRVRVDRTRPALGWQRIGFELYPRTDRSRPSLGTVLAQEGGPGYPTTGSRSYYRQLYRPLGARRALLLVDQRGTGVSGALRCATLQRGTGPYLRAVAACGAQLGERADTYGTAYAADDTAAVLDALGIDRVELYGDSYGTFFAQTFALRHPDRVHTMVLDASYPVSGQDPWWRDTNRAIRRALTRVCARDTTCPTLRGTPVSRLAKLARQVSRDPVAGRTVDGEGVPRKAVVNGVNLALVTSYATYGTSIYRELDAAVRAFEKGYRDPLLRLVGENISTDGDSGAPIDYSAGAYIAVICNDYPQLWDVKASPTVRRDQFGQAVADLRATDPGAFAPFSIDDWVKSGWSEPRTCLGWPAPDRVRPPEPPKAVYPSTPTLVLSGDLDSITSPEGGRDVASRFPNATFVSVPNSGHVTALGDKQGCVASIVRSFVRSGGTVGDTSCVSGYAPVRAVPRFARSSAGLDPATQGTRVRSPVGDRKVVTAAAFAAGDVITRWFVNYTGAGVGLAGGRFTYQGLSDVRFALRRLSFVADVQVTGSVRWNRNDGQVRARLVVDGPGGRDGRLRMQWSDWRSGATAHVVGRLGGRGVDLVTRAP